MEFSIQQLFEKRKKWVEANRENEFEDGIKRLLTDLYPDNAHFIYELLQNAEDAGASAVRFILNDNRLEFEHNGDRLFSIEDVNSITSIGVSTKGNDPTTIGEFGVGFKAVFAYTSTPEIESGEYHFRIRDMVVPVTDGLSPGKLGEKITRFKFPFDNPKKSPENARAEIEKNLRLLNKSTLLFLSNIRKIGYLLPDSTLGFLERVESGGSRVELFVQHPEESKPESAVFLRFEKMVNVNDDDGKPKSCRIAIAFFMEKKQEAEESGKKEEQYLTNEWRIKPVVPGQVSIYFPADKETSNLRFHLHAPFASTIARDSVRDCSANNELRDHLKKLITESMTTIRDQGLLTVGFLATLPNDKDNLSSFYKPILDSLIRAFQCEKLTPMKQGGHAPANKIFRGPAQLSNLISDGDLATILGKGYLPPLWVANPPQRNQREDSFLSSLEIKEWTTEDLINALNSQPNQIENLMAAKTDEWHQGLYALLSEYLAHSVNKSLMTLRIVRISDGTYRIGKDCFFPGDGIDHDDFMPRVAKGVYTSGKNEQQQKKAKEFLEEVGVREVGEVEKIEAILRKYYIDEAEKPDDKTHARHLESFISLVEKDPFRAKMFGDYFIFKIIDKKWRKPSQVYLDSPFFDTGLTVYYETLGDESQCWALSKDYEDYGIKPEKIGEFAKKVGSKTNLDIEKKGDYYSTDFYIYYLKSILKLKNIRISKLIWCTLLSNETGSPDYFYIFSRKDGRYNYSPAGDSSIIALLKQNEWVPQIDPKINRLTFSKPYHADSKLLPDGFTYDNQWKWLKAVEFGSSIRQREEAERLTSQSKNSEFLHAEEAAKSLGFTSSEEAKEMAELKQKDPDGFKKWQERNQEKPKFPTREVPNPERRLERVHEEYDVAPEKKYDKHDISVRETRRTVDPSTWLKKHYTNYDNQMVCQICKNEMPFKKRNLEYYFEAVEAFTREYFSKEHEAQYLALCPLCAAKYKEFVKTDENAMRSLKEAILSKDQPVSPLSLGKEDATIEFVEKHYSDIKTILKKQE